MKRKFCNEIGIRPLQFDSGRREIKFEISLVDDELDFNNPTEYYGYIYLSREFLQEILKKIS